MGKVENDSDRNQHSSLEFRTQDRLEHTNIPVATARNSDKIAPTINDAARQETTKKEKQIEKAHGFKPKDKQSFRE